MKKLKLFDRFFMIFFVFSDRFKNKHAKTDPNIT